MSIKLFKKTMLILGFGFDLSQGSAYGVELLPLGTSGPFLSASQVAKHVRNAGFPTNMVNRMVRIAKCESSFGVTSFAWGQRRRHTGLFQISDLHHKACGYGSKSLGAFRNVMTDPAANARCAYTVYKNAGYSVRPWDCARR